MKLAWEDCCELEPPPCAARLFCAFLPTAREDFLAAEAIVTNESFCYCSLPSCDCLCDPLYWYELLFSCLAVDESPWLPEPAFVTIKD